MPNLYSLSDTAIRAVKAGDPRKRLTDGKGLYLLLFVKGGAHGWRLDYSIHGRRKTLSLGTYPETSLKLAREKAEEARRLIAAGVDPSEHRKAAKAVAQQERQVEALVAAGQPLPGSFEALAHEWFEVRRTEWAESYSSKVFRRLELEVFPWLGRRPIGSITPAEMLTVLRRIEMRGVLDTAHRVREICSQVFRYAVATGQADSDPTRDLKGALRKHIVKHMAAITDPAALAELLRAIDGYRGSLVVCTALRLAPMLMLRPGELRFAEWAEIDLSTATWAIPAARMKRKKEGKLYGAAHLVPLPRQAVELLQGLYPLTGSGRYVFRGERDHDRVMSDNTINAALRRMGYSTSQEMTGHGFRATARTILDERLGFDRAAIEAQLAHSVKDLNGRAYNRTEFVEQRRVMLQAWADYLDRLRQGNVQSLRACSG